MAFDDVFPDLNAPVTVDTQEQLDRINAARRIAYGNPEEAATKTTQAAQLGESYESLRYQKSPEIAQRLAEQRINRTLMEHPEMLDWAKKDPQGADMAGDDSALSSLAGWFKDNIRTARHGWRAGRGTAEQGIIYDNAMTEGLRDLTEEEKKRSAEIDEMNRRYGIEHEDSTLYDFTNLLGTWLGGFQHIPSKTAAESAGIGAVIGGAGSTALATGGAMLAPVTGGASLGVAVAAGMTYAGFRNAYAIEGGLNYKELLEAGLTKDEAFLYSRPVALINAGLEFFPALHAAKIAGAPAVAAIKKSMGKLAKRDAIAMRYTWGKIGLDFLKGTLVGGGEETSTEILQEANGILWEEIGKRFSSAKDLEGKSADEIAEQIWDVAKHTWRGASVMSALVHMPGAAHSIHGIREAKRNKAFLEQVATTAQGSKLHERSPSHFGSFVAHIAGTGKQTLYIDGRSFHQAVTEAGLTEEQVQAVFGDTGVQQMRHETGDSAIDVEISLQDYAAKVSGTTADPIFQPYVRTDREGYTYAQAVENEVEAAREARRARDGLGDSFRPLSQEEVAALSDRDRKTYEATAARSRVRQRIARSLTNAVERGGLDAKVFTPAQIAWNASMTTRAYEKLAGKLNIPLEDFARRFGADITWETETGVGVADRFDTPVDVQGGIGSLRQILTQARGEAVQGEAAEVTQLRNALNAMPPEQRQSVEALLSAIGDAQPASALAPGAQGLVDRARGGETASAMNAVQALWRAIPQSTRNQIEAALPAEMRTELQNVRNDYRTRDLIRASRMQSAPVNQEVSEIEAVRRQYEGSDQWMKAPNGKPTNLTERQWLQVRTPSFKAWFGDWEANPAAASKVVDENGEPLVVYHNGTFTEDGNAVANGAMHFGTLQAARDRMVAKTAEDSVDTFEDEDGWHWSDGVYDSEDAYASEQEARDAGIRAALESTDFQDDLEAGTTTAAFLNIRNPSAEKDAVDNWNPVIDAAREKGADGIRYVNQFEDKGSTSWIAFEPNQIKSATDNNGNFDPANPNIYRQSAESGEMLTAQEREFLASQDKWLSWTPPVTGTGVVKGAPPRYESNEQFPALLKSIKQFLKEGAVGRWWYEASAKFVLDFVRGDVKEAERLIQLIAIYSPQMKIGANLLLALRAYVYWLHGGDINKFKLKTGVQDEKAKGVLWRNEKWEGRKTNTFYLNLMYEVARSHPAECRAAGMDVDAILDGKSTIDMWMKRAFGYDSDATGNDKGTGQYSFCENTLKRITAEINKDLAPGEEPWLPHQVQAAIWTGIMSRYTLVKEATDLQFREAGLAVETPVLTKSGEQVLTKDGKPKTRWERLSDAESERKQMRIWHDNAMQVDTEESREWAVETARSYATEFERMTQVVTWEAVPAPALTKYGDLLNASHAVKKMFTDEVKEVFVAPDGTNELAEALGIGLYFDKNSTGGFGGAISPNVLTSLLPVWWGDQGEPSKAQVRTFCRVVQYVAMQEAVPFMRIENRPAWIAKNKFKVCAEGGSRAIRTFDTQAEAEADCAERNKKSEGKKKYVVKGGRFARAVVLKYKAPLTLSQQEALLAKLGDRFGEDAGLTVLSSDSVLVANYRNEKTGLPWGMHDEDFVKTVEDATESEPLADVLYTWVDSEYGRVQDWKADPEGKGILAELGILKEGTKSEGQRDDASGSSAVDPRYAEISRDKLDRWRSRYEEVLSRFTGKELAKREAEARDIEQRARDAASAQQQSGQVSPVYNQAAAFTPDQSLINAAVENFGITNDPREAGYILPDGRMLDFSGRHWGGGDGGSRIVEHNDISEVDGIEGGGTDAMVEFMARTGAMRVDVNAGIASSAQNPTPEQMGVLSVATRGKPLSLSLITTDGRIVADRELARSNAGSIREFFGQAQGMRDRGQVGNVYAQTAYHGTPNQFDRFDLSHLGEGEGAQAHGWGLYFTGSLDVAEGYWETLTPYANYAYEMTYNGKTYSGGHGWGGVELRSKPSELEPIWDFVEGELIARIGKEGIGDADVELSASRLKDWINARVSRLEDELRSAKEKQAKQEPRNEDEDWDDIDVPMPGSLMSEKEKKTLLAGNLADFNPDDLGLDGLDEFVSDLQVESLEKQIAALKAVNPDTMNLNISITRKTGSSGGRVFKVDIPEERFFLQEDTVLFSQSKEVKDALTKAGLYDEDGSKRKELVERIDAIQRQADDLYAKNPNDPEVERLIAQRRQLAARLSILDNATATSTGADLYAALTGVLGNEKAASQYLLSRGIQGISYEGYRDGQCWVLFDDRAVQITRYWQALGESGAIKLSDRMTLSLETARAMEKNGRKPIDVKIATGWERGYDGKWRYEIPDGKVKPAQSGGGIYGTPEGKHKLGDLYEAEQLYTAYPELRDLDVIIEPYSDPRTTAWFDGNAIHINSNSAFLDRKFKALATARDKAARADEVLTKVNEGFTEEERDDAEERGIRLPTYSQAERAEARARGEVDRINADIAKQLRYAIVHEVQHWIQDREGFASGTNAEAMAEAIRNAPEGSRLSSLSPEDAYRFSGGEGESRAMEERLRMSEEERRRTLIIDSFDVAPEDLILMEGNSGASSLPRGSFDPRNNTIRLTANANLSTFAHEMGHWYLESLGYFVSQGMADEGLVNDFNALLSSFGVGSVAEWNALPDARKEVCHERFAAWVEEYLATGDCPVPEAKPILRRFKDWIISVYKDSFLYTGSVHGALSARHKNLFGEDLPALSDEVRQVLDHALMSNEEMAQLEAQQGTPPLFAEKPEGVTDQEWQDYVERMQARTEEGREALAQKNLEKMKWAQAAHSKVLRRVQAAAAKVRKQMEEIARDRVLAPGTLWGKIDAVKRLPRDLRLSEDGLDAYLSADEIAQLKRYHIVAGKGYGIPLSDFCANWGFDDPREFLQSAVVHREAIKLHIEAIADQLMQERYPAYASEKDILNTVADALAPEVAEAFAANEIAFIERQMHSTREGVALGNKRADQMGVAGEDATSLTRKLQAAEEELRQALRDGDDARAETAKAEVEMRRAQIRKLDRNSREAESQMSSTREGIEEGNRRAEERGVEGETSASLMSKLRQAEAEMRQAVRDGDNARAATAKAEVETLRAQIRVLDRNAREAERQMSSTREGIEEGNRRAEERGVEGETFASLMSKLRRAEAEMRQAVRDGDNANAATAKAEVETLRAQIRKIARDSRNIAQTTRVELLDAQNAAELLLGMTPLGRISPTYYLGLAKQSASRALKAMAANDLPTALAEKRNQLVYQVMARRAMQIEKGEIRKVLNVRRSLSQSDEKLGKTRDVDLLNYLRAVLGEFGLQTPNQKESAGAYIERIREYDPNLAAGLTQMYQRLTANAMPWQSLTYADFQAFAEQVGAIWFLARQSKQIEIDGKKKDIAETREALANQLRARYAGKNNAHVNSTPTKKDKVWQKVLSLDAGLRRVLSWCRDMDEGNPERPFMRYVYEPVKKGIDTYRTRQREVGKRLTAIYEQYEKARTKHEGKIVAHELMQYDEFGEVSNPDPWVFHTKSELIGALLHTGNASNKQKLVGGYRWGAVSTDENGREFVDCSGWDAFIQRMVEEGVLTKADFDFVQAMWDVMESIKPETQAAYHEITGMYFSEITNTPFTVQFPNGTSVTYKGGYAPAKVDPAQVRDHSADEEQALHAINQSYGYPTGGMNFTKSRTEQYREKLLMDIDLVASHVNEALRMAHIEKPARDVFRLFANKKFKSLFNAYGNPFVIDQMLIPWLNRSVNQTVTTAETNTGIKVVSKILTEVKRRTGLVAMAGNLANALEEVSGFSVALTRVPGAEIRRALLAFHTGKLKADDVMALSPHMRARLQDSELYALERAENTFKVEASKLDRASAFCAAHGYILQQIVQRYVDVPVWWAAYEDAQKRGYSPEEAVQIADEVIDETMSSNTAEGISAIEGGTPLHRALLMFYNYFNMQYNLLHTELGRAVRMGQYGKAAWAFATVCLIPQLISDLFSRLVGSRVGEEIGGGDDDDDDDWWIIRALRYFAGQTLQAGFNIVPTLGQAGNWLSDIVSGEEQRFGSQRISMTPTVNTVEAAGRLPKDFARVMDGKGYRSAVRDSLQVISVITGIPFAQPFGRPLGYLADVAEGKTDDGVIDTARGLVSGKSPNRK